MSEWLNSWNIHVENSEIVIEGRNTQSWLTAGAKFLFFVSRQVPACWVELHVCLVVCFLKHVEHVQTMIVFCIYSPSRLNSGRRSLRQKCLGRKGITHCLVNPTIGYFRWFEQRPQPKPCDYNSETRVFGHSIFCSLNPYIYIYQFRIMDIPSGKLT